MKRKIQSKKGMVLLEELKRKTGVNIRNLRLKNNETLVQLAEKLGVRHATVSDWENGKKMPRSSTIQKLAEYYKVSMTDIISDIPVSERTREILDSDIIDLEQLLKSETRLIYKQRVLSLRDKAILNKLVKAVILEDE